MAILIADCPRCDAQNMTFDVEAQLNVGNIGWRRFAEIFCVCRHCEVSTVFLVKQKQPNHEAIFQQGAMVSYKNSISEFVDIDRYIGLRDHLSEAPPDHVPEGIKSAFVEGATCLAVDCWNAAAAMFRLCVDLATRPMLPEEDREGLTSRVRRDLGLRLPWLFKNGYLPTGLVALSACIREDGNDGAHAGNLEKADAEDLLDFTRALLERLYTEPEKLKIAQARRDERRAPKTEF